jgi:hypothetical protein
MPTSVLRSVAATVADADDDAPTIVTDSPAFLSGNDATIREPIEDDSKPDLEAMDGVDAELPQAPVHTARNAASPPWRRPRAVIALTSAFLALVATATVAVHHAHVRSRPVVLPPELFRQPPLKSHPTILFAVPVPAGAISNSRAPDATAAGPNGSIERGVRAVVDHQPPARPKRTHRSHRDHLDEHGILIPAE